MRNIMACRLTATSYSTSIKYDFAVAHSIGEDETGARGTLRVKCVYAYVYAYAYFHTF